MGERRTNLLEILAQEGPLPFDGTSHEGKSRTAVAEPWGSGWGAVVTSSCLRLAEGGGGPSVRATSS